MTSQQQEMIEYTTQEVIEYLIEDYGLSMEQAMDRFYMSDCFEKLSDTETGLYLEGSAYIYEMLKKEFKKKEKGKKLALSDEILLSIDKPARYLGNEIKAVYKDKDQVDVRFCM